MIVSVTLEPQQGNFAPANLAPVQHAEMTIAALSALAVLVYTYFVYPILIALCARIRPMRIRKDPGHTPKVSALIPVYNAESYIADKLESLLNQDYPAERFEILLLSDGSNDGSDKILASYAEKYPDRIRVFRSDERSGKPSALNRMRQEATGEVLLMTDIRQPVNQRCLRELVSYFGDPEIGAVSGNLELQGGTGAGFYWKYEKWIRKSEGSFRSMVGVTGALYMVRKRDLVDIPLAMALDDMWVPMRLRLQRKRVAFAPEAIAYDQAFEDDREFGRKTRTLAGNYQLFGALPKLLVPLVNPSWFETFSHKILRLLCPWALLALLATSAGALWQGEEATSVWEYRILLALGAGQVAFYLLALAGKVAGKLGNIARTFVVLNAAAIVGLWRHLRQSQKITW
jgi:cellulose synthase/poly-beta-1,6-N-acetylglucosamine synthase-like glycosyltransferase